MDKSIVPPKKPLTPEQKVIKNLKAREQYHANAELREKINKQTAERHRRKMESDPEYRDRILERDRAAQMSKRSTNDLRITYNKRQNATRAKQKENQKEAERLKKLRSEKYQLKKNDANWIEKKRIYSAQNQRKRMQSPEKKAKALAATAKYIKETNYLKNRKEKDHVFAAVCRIRSVVGNAIRRANQTKAGTAESYLGCTIAEARIHIEKQFKDGMGWNSDMHIDHIMPIAAFDKTDPSWAHKANHFTNLQPLWAKENLSKGSKTVKL